ncbi:MAG: GtrA family protein [Haloarculaceae archaeon]
MTDDVLARIRHYGRALASGMRLGKFVSVGVVGAVFDTTVLLVLTESFGVLPELATVAGIETAILVMFAINERWTFAEAGADDGRSLLGRLVRSHFVRAGGSTTQFVVFVVVYRLLFVSLVLGDVGPAVSVLDAVGLHGLASVDLWLVVAKGAGIAVGMVVNYVFESLFTWRVHADTPR